MNALRHLFAWVAATACCALLVPVLSPAAATVERIDHWQRQIERDLGAAASARVSRRAQVCVVTVRSHLADWQPEQPHAPSRRAGQPASGAQRAVGSMAGLACVRAATLTAWLSVLGPVWFGAAVQGWVIRDIRRERFAAKNPLIYQACLQGAVALSGAAVLAMVLPVDLPLAGIPVGGALLAVLLAFAVVHRPTWGS